MFSSFALKHKSTDQKEEQHKGNSTTSARSNPRGDRAQTCRAIGNGTAGPDGETEAGNWWASHQGCYD